MTGLFHQNLKSFLDTLETVDVDMVITDFTEQHVYNNTTVRNDFIDKYEVGKKYTGIPNVRIPMHSVTYKTSILSENKIRLSEKHFMLILNTLSFLWSMFIVSVIGIMIFINTT